MSEAEGDRTEWRALIRRSSHAVAQELQDGSVGLLELRTGEYFTLNATGALIWDLVGEGATIEQLVSELQALGVQAPDLADQVAHFVTALRERRLIDS